MQHIHQQDKGENIIIDEDGFQQVRHRRSTWRNIFDIVNDNLRKNALELGEEVRATRYRSKQQGIEASQAPGIEMGNTTKISWWVANRWPSKNDYNVEAWGGDDKRTSGASCRA